LFWAPSESEDVVGRQPAHQQRGGGTAHAGVCGGPAGGADVDAVARDHGFGQTVALLEFAFLVGVQIVTHVGWDDDIDADQALGLGPSDQAPRCRAGNAESGRDLGLGEAVEVVERRGAQCEPQVFRGGCAVLRRRHGLASNRPGDLAGRRRNGHLGAPSPA
jgi:hypothetical protein